MTFKHNNKEITYIPNPVLQDAKDKIDEYIKKITN